MERDRAIHRGSAAAPRATDVLRALSRLSRQRRALEELVPEALRVLGWWAGCATIGVRFAAAAEHIESERPAGGTYAAVPLQDGDDVLGTLFVTDPRPDLFDIERLRELEALAGCLALVLSSTRDGRRLDETDLRLAGLFDRAFVPFLLFSQGGRLESANPAACALYRRSVDDLAGRSVRDLIHPDEHGRMAGVFAELAQTGHFQTDAVNVRGDGTSFHAHVRGQMLPLKGGRRLLVMVDDTSGRRGSEARVDRPQEHLQAMAGHLASSEGQTLGRIVRDLHDGAGQSISALSSQLARLDALMEREGDACAEARAIVAAAHGLVEDTAVAVRNAIGELRPSVPPAPPAIDDRELPSTSPRASSAGSEGDTSASPGETPDGPTSR